MLNFLKQYWSQIILIAIIIVGFFYFEKQLNDKNGKIYLQDSLIQVTQTIAKKTAQEYQNLTSAWNDLKSKNDSLYDALKKAKEEPRSVTQIILQTPTSSVTRIDSTYKPIVIHDTILVPIGQDSVKIKENYADIVDIDGSTWIYPLKGYKLNFKGKEVPVDVVISEDKNGVFTSYVDTHNPNLKIKNITTRVLREPKSFWSQIGFLTGAEFTNINTSLKLGIGFSDWYLHATGGYDYRNLQINKNNLFYGLGVIKLW